MADLLDIAPATSIENVRIVDGRWIKVRGLQFNDMASIAARFPDLVGLLGGGGDNIGPRLMAQFGAVVPPVIAAGSGHLGNEKAEQIASGLLIEDQLKLVTAIYRLTFPNGLGPFTAAITQMNGAPSEKPKPVKVRLKTSPSASPPSSAEASLPTMQ